MKKKKLYLSIGAILALGLIGGTIGKNYYTNYMKARFMANIPETINPVETFKITLQNWTPIINSVGIVESEQSVDLTMQSNGVVEEILVKEGQHVKAGDVILTLNNDVEEAQLAQYQAQLENAKQVYERYERLLKSNSISQDSFDTAKTNYKSLEANVNSLKANLERRKVIAPFDGDIGIINVTKGEYVAVGKQIGKIENNDVMKITFSIPQDNLKDLFIGQKVVANIDALKGETFEARIVSIDNNINKENGLIDVKAIFEKNDKLMTGMYAKLRVNLKELENKIVVPQTAISYNLYGENIFVLRDVEPNENRRIPQNLKNDVKKVEQVIVKTQDRAGVNALIESNHIKNGDKIVISGVQRLSNNSLVQEKNGDETPVGVLEPSVKNKL